VIPGHSELPAQDAQDLQHCGMSSCNFLRNFETSPIPERLTDVVLARWTFEQDIASMCEAFSSCDLTPSRLSLVIGDSVLFSASPHYTATRLHLQIDSPIAWKVLSRIVSPHLSRPADRVITLA